MTQIYSLSDKLRCKVKVYDKDSLVLRLQERRWWGWKNVYWELVVEPFAWAPTMELKSNPHINYCGVEQYVSGTFDIHKRIVKYGLEYQRSI
jgi:hypothetical protein